MEYLTKKLPLILSCVMALITGILGFLANKDSNFIYTSMLVSILFFWIIGLIVREFITAVLVENKKKAKDAEDEESKNKQSKGSVIDLKTDDSKNLEDIELNMDVSKKPEVNSFYGDGFSPLEVSKVIRTNVNNDN